MSYYLLGGLIGGLILSQTVTFLRKTYELICEGDKRREAKLQDMKHNVQNEMIVLSQSLEKFMEAEQRKQWRFLTEKADVLDQKLSLVLTKVTCSSVTGTGTYQTSVGADGAGIKKLRVMSQMVDDVGGKISNTYKEWLAKFGERKEELTTTKLVNDVAEGCEDFRVLCKGNIHRSGVYNKAPKELMCTPDMEQLEKNTFVPIDYRESAPDVEECQNYKNEEDSKNLP